MYTSLSSRPPYLLRRERVDVNGFNLGFDDPGHLMMSRRLCLLATGDRGRGR